MSDFDAPTPIQPTHGVRPWEVFAVFVVVAACGLVVGFLRIPGEVALPDVRPPAHTLFAMPERLMQPVMYGTRMPAPDVPIVICTSGTLRWKAREDGFCYIDDVPTRRR